LPYNSLIFGTQVQPDGNPTAHEWVHGAEQPKSRRTVIFQKLCDFKPLPNLENRQKNERTGSNNLVWTDLGSSGLNSTGCSDFQRTKAAAPDVSHPLLRKLPMISLPYSHSSQSSSGLALPWVVGGLAVIAIWLDVSDQTTPALMALAAALGILFIFLLTSWSSIGAFLGFWVWIHLEDLVRLVIDSFAVFFVKDILLAGLFIGYWFDWHRKRFREPKTPLALPLFLYAIITVIQCFNPEVPNLLIPLVGLHAKLLYIPLFFIARAYFDSELKVRHFLTFVMLVLALESVIALVQYFRDPSWWYMTLNISPDAEVIGYRTYDTGEGLLKTGSIFIHAGRFTQFVLVVSIVILGFRMIFREQPGLSFIWTLTVVVVFAGGILLQSSRAVFYLFSFSSVIILFVHAYSIKIMTKTPILLIALLGIVCWGTTKIDERILDFYLAHSSLDISFEEYDSIGGRINRGLLQLQSSIEQSGIWGHGTGTSSQGLHHITGTKEMPKENGYAALIWEFGVLGPMLWLFLMGTLLVHAWRAYQSVRSTIYSQLAFSIVVMISFSFLLQYIGLQYLENYLVVTHFWTFAGMLFALPNLSANSTGGRLRL
jgi:hypothetical protein